MYDIGTACTYVLVGYLSICYFFQHIGCDYVIDSKAIEDRCGMCHGDGSTCTTVKSQYNETQGLGMYCFYIQTSSY